MKEFEVNGLTYRVKKMNAIEFFALKQSIDFENIDTTTQTLNVLLEKTEVKCGDQWLPVRDRKKINGVESVMYYPSGIEEDYDAIPELISKVVGEIKTVFQKSSV